MQEMPMNRIRFYKPKDLERLKEIHRKQGFGYDFPQLEPGTGEDRKPVHDTYVSKIILADENDRPMGAMIGRKTTEVFLILDPECGSPAERWKHIQALYGASTLDGWRLGFTDAHCWIPPEIERGYGRRLRTLGFNKQAWASYCLKWEDKDFNPLLPYLNRKG
jgi:hypothetical protein